MMLIELHVKRWTSPTYGNTYSSARLYVNDRLVKVFPMVYGTNTEFDARDWLLNEGILSCSYKSPGPLSLVARECGAVYRYDYSYVKKAECLEHGVSP